MALIIFSAVGPSRYFLIIPTEYRLKLILLHNLAMCESRQHVESNITPKFLGGSSLGEIDWSPTLIDISDILLSSSRVVMIRSSVNYFTTYIVDYFTTYPQHRLWWNLPTVCNCDVNEHPQPRQPNWDLSIWLIFKMIFGNCIPMSVPVDTVAERHHHQQICATHMMFTKLSICW